VHELNHLKMSSYSIRSPSEMYEGLAAYEQIRTAIRHERVNQLDELWKLYKEGIIPYPRAEREYDVSHISNHDVLKWMISNEFLPPLVLLSNVTTYNEELIPVVMDAVGYTHQTWDVVVSTALTNNDLSVLNWVTCKGVDITPFLTDERIYRLLTQEEYDNDSENDNPSPSLTLEYLCEKHNLQFTRDMLDTALSGRNEKTISVIVLKSPETVCQATAYVAIQNNATKSIWRCLLNTGKITLDEALLNNIVRNSNPFIFDFAIFVEFGAQFTEKHARIVIQKKQHHKLVSLITHCGVSLSDQSVRLIYDSANPFLIDALKRCRIWKPSGTI
jgi:hypothetical protein